MKVLIVIHSFESFFFLIFNQFKHKAQKIRRKLCVERCLLSSSYNFSQLKMLIASFYFFKNTTSPSQNISLQLSLQEFLSFSLDSFKMCFHFQNFFTPTLMMLSFYSTPKKQLNVCLHFTHIS